MGSSCTSCIEGFTLTHELDSECSVSQDYKKITSSKGWRVWTTNTQTDSWHSWDVLEIEFYDTIDCSGEIIPNSDEYSVSGSANSYYGPHQAFGGDGLWGGRRDSDDLFYIGMMYDSEVQLKCVKLFISDSNKWTSEVRIQAYNESENSWENAWIEKNLNSTETVNVIPLLYSPSSRTFMPSSRPSFMPSSRPSFMPSLRPSFIPSFRPSVVTSLHPSSSPMSSSDEF